MAAVVNAAETDVAQTVPEADRAATTAATPPAEGVEANGSLRFAIGEAVLCNMSRRANGFLWKPGKVAALWHDTGSDGVAPYIVELEDGKLGCAPEDDDECIRLAARATLDVRVLRSFARRAGDRGATQLRFMEGDRVAVQLNIRNWEEGVVTETWATPERRGRPLKGWAGLALPYAVRLDLNEDVLVPFDSEDVIRSESANRPRPQPIEEILGGKRRAPKPAEGPRFKRQRNAAGTWVVVDTVTGAERRRSSLSSDSE
mmetsp:Transcript_46046/g.103582  ORF Transcript_46046/g.103582 Transcript_46046/m.103582 type:complete len:259 (-) Transcript_46046:120-896(-)|eukprot:CAMPEP_0197914842 /NCGR_PEP_ID=MMETSP1439-20131203/79202_1 /TAXON_ID=66791 /ORGANISM="Gonyaulax spinifera, Strain CCMP409" /LENGTH=258 /DNA_ID=CAMNT_0043536767 /DNA_START=102 /DNA_END=878 /DNA_ORIENTATION=+